MRKQILLSTLAAAIVAILLLGVPLCGFIINQLWATVRANVDQSAQEYTLVYDRNTLGGRYVTDVTLAEWLWPGTGQDTRVEIVTADGRKLAFGSDPEAARIIPEVTTATGVELRLFVSSEAVHYRSVFFIIATLTGMAASAFVGASIVFRPPRRISTPLICLCAQAQQLSSSGMRSRLDPSRIEEIDLVQAELVRSSETLAGRLTVEHQFVSDVSHQLHTPLTALSMRLEEIQMISTEDEVQHEVGEALDQIERLTGVVEDLKRNAQRTGGGTTQTIDADDFLIHQQSEWEGPFRVAACPLAFRSETDRPALATPGSLGQVIATLLKNPLKYGSSTTTIRAKMSANNKGMFFKVNGERSGVDDEIAPGAFKKGVSGHGLTRIGLALAKQPIEADGEKLELTVRRPPTFGAYVSAAPASLDPKRVMSQGALVSVSRPKRRF